MEVIIFVNTAIEIYCIVRNDFKVVLILTGQLIRKKNQQEEMDFYKNSVFDKTVEKSRTWQALPIKHYQEDESCIIVSRTVKNNSRIKHVCEIWLSSKIVLLKILFLI